MSTNKPSSIGITIRFRDKEQLELIRSAARHRLIAFNTFVREAAEMAALSSLAMPAGLLQAPSKSEEKA